MQPAGLSMGLLFYALLTFPLNSTKFHQCIDFIITHHSTIHIQYMYISEIGAFDFSQNIRAGGQITRNCDGISLPTCFSLHLVKLLTKSRCKQGYLGTRVVPTCENSYVELLSLFAG